MMLSLINVCFNIDEHEIVLVILSNNSKGTSLIQVLAQVLHNLFFEVILHPLFLFPSNSWTFLFQYMIVKPIRWDIIFPFN